MSRLRSIYAVLALLGAVVPLCFHAGWLAENRWNPVGLPAAWGANAAAAGAMWDVVIAGVALIVWIAAECRRRKRWGGLWAIPVTCLIGPGCGLPLYLLLRSNAGGD